MQHYWDNVNAAFCLGEGSVIIFWSQKDKMSGKHFYNTKIVNLWYQLVPLSHVSVNISFPIALLNRGIVYQFILGV